MAWGRRKNYRRSNRKRFNNKRVVKRYLRRKTKKGLQVYKLRGVNYFASNVAGENSDVYSMSNPGAYLNGASSLQDLSNITALFDSYRICAIKLKYIPQKPFDPSSATAYLPLYIVPDFDDETANTSVAQVVQYERLKIKDLSKPWGYYLKVPKLGGGVASPTAGYGWFDINAAPNQAGIKLFATGLNTSAAQYGTIIATYYCAFKNRR